MLGKKTCFLQLALSGCIWAGSAVATAAATAQETSVPAELSDQQEITLTHEQMLAGIKRMIVAGDLGKRDWTVLGFASVLSYTFTNNRSNIDFFSFSRSRAKIGITRQF